MPVHVLEVLDDDLGVELSPNHGSVRSYLVQVKFTSHDRRFF